MIYNYKICSNHIDVVNWLNRMGNSINVISIAPSHYNQNYIIFYKHISNTTSNLNNEFCHMC